MGIHRENGYSASVEAYLVVDEKRIPVAKTNDTSLALAEPCELPPGTIGDLVIIVDDDERSQVVSLPDGSISGQTIVNYLVAVPF